MIGNTTRLLALAAALTLAVGSARAQYGYGYHYPYGAGWGGGGFGGWGSTVQGSPAAGMGVFAAGAGQYNVQTAQARSMNANTAMQWNSYWNNMQHNINVSSGERMARERQKVNESADATQKRLRDNPNEGDIDRGDAFNAILVQMTDPNLLQGSGLALATQPISADLVKGIPFRYAPEMAVLCIDTFRNNIPDLLMSDDLKAEREAFAGAVKQAMADIKAGKEVTPQEVAEVKKSGRALYSKVENGLPNANAKDRREALTYLKNLKVFLKMLKAPDFQRTLADLKQSQETTVGHLIAFMHTYNLRFGPATTQEQRAVYRRLYPVLRNERDRVLGLLASRNVAPAPTPPPTPQGPGELFQGIEDKHLNEPGGGN